MAGEREDLGKLTVAILRSLAKQRLSRGISKLRTKAQLIEALLAAGPSAPGSSPAGSDPISAKAVGRSPKRDPLGSSRPKARGPRGPRKLPRLPTEVPEPLPAAAAGAPAAAAGAPAAIGGALSASGEARPTQALPLDGQTLLVRWGTVAAERGERWELEVSSDGGSTRTIPVRPRTRQAYVRALPTGAIYRTTLVARTPAGARRVIGAVSRPVVLFPSSERIMPAERFVRYAWSDPASSTMAAAVASPGSAFVAGADEQSGPGGQGGHGTPPGSAPTSPSGSIAGPPLGWLLGSQRPTSFAN